MPEQIFVHPNYNYYTYDYDIALIKLSKQVTFTDYVRPACLAESTNETAAYTRCLVSGWGDTEIGTYIIKLSLTYQFVQKQTNMYVKLYIIVIDTKMPFFYGGQTDYV